MKKFLNSLITNILTTIFLTIITSIGVFVFSVLLQQGLLYTFYVNLNLYGIFLLSFAAVLGLHYLIAVFKN